MIDYDKVVLIRSKRRSVALEIKPDGYVYIRAPKKMSLEDIRAFVLKHEKWLEKHLKEIEIRESKQDTGRLSMDEVRELAQKASIRIPERVKYFAPLIGVTYGRITIRNQKTRWGSCSSKGNLNFNCLLMLTPPEVIDSVVVHELCHRKEMNHSKKFYDEIYRVYPEYDRWNKWLKEHEGTLLSRMP